MPRKRSDRQQAWDKFGLPQAGKAALTNYNKNVRPFRPRCDAKRKSDGEACQNIALEGRSKCRVHGGSTPAGDNWHQRQWPNGNAPDWQRKLNDKLKRAERDQRRKERRLAKMSPDERQRHEEWQKAHKPGSAAERARKREDRKRAAEIRASLETVEQKPVSPELAELQAKAAALEAARDHYRRMAEEKQDEGVFG